MTDRPAVDATGTPAGAGFKPAVPRLGPRPSRVRPTLITGGAGFIGSNLADHLAEAGEPILILDSLARPGVERNLDWLRRRHRGRIAFVHHDIRDADAVADAVADAGSVFHFAAQVAVTTSMDDPGADFAVNVGGTFALLEALRRRGEPVPLVFASTNKVYGDLADVALEPTERAYRPVDPAIRAHGVGEDRSLDFHTPYGCSKGAADQYVLDYARSFGLPTAVLRMSCIYGPRQMGTEDQGWVAHFLIKALRGEPISIYGDGRQVRDVLYVEDCVAAYCHARKRIGAVAGRAFNLGGGPRNAISLLDLLAAMEQMLGRPVERVMSDWRPGDQRYFVADTRRAMRDLELGPMLDWRNGLRLLCRWLAAEGIGADGDAAAGDKAPVAAETSVEAAFAASAPLRAEAS